MLKIWFGNIENVIYNTVVYFKNRYEPEWLEDPFVKEMILDVDHSKVLSGYAIESPVLGTIPPERLSGGVKTLILIDKDTEKIFNASNCGDNCAKWLLKMGEQKDITINLRHLMEFGEGNFDIYVMNNQMTVHNMEELLNTVWRYV